MIQNVGIGAVRALIMHGDEDRCSAIVEWHMLYTVVRQWYVCGGRGLLRCVNIENIHKRMRVVRMCVY